VPTDFKPPIWSETVGDIHGDLQKAIRCLEVCGVLDEGNGRPVWVGGDTTVVQLGDVLDRGNSEIGGLLRAISGFTLWSKSSHALNTRTHARTHAS
jgi:hypothetical protein